MKRKAQSTINNIKVNGIDENGELVQMPGENVKSNDDIEIDLTKDWNVNDENDSRYIKNRPFYD
mgnify:CR=1 FL=1